MPTVHRVFGVCAVLGGCGSPTERATPLFEQTTIECAPQAVNALRIDCDVALPVPATIAMRAVLPQADIDPREASSTEPDTHHQLTLQGLLPEQETLLEIAIDGGPWTGVGTLTTDAVMPSIDITVEHFEGNAQVHAVALNAECNDDSYVALIDVEGRVRWYEDVSHLGAIDAFEITDDSVVVLAGREHLVEVGLDGSPIRTWGPDILGTYVHHDVITRDGRTLVLTGQPWTDPDTGLVYMHEGVRVFDADGTIVADWIASDFLSIPPSLWGESGFWDPYSPGILQAYHLNSLFLDGDDWLVSFTSASMVVRVIGDPTRQDFGTIAWMLDGAGHEGDYEVGDQAGFHSQHHVRRSEHGNLMLFDNGSAARGSRGLELTVDEASQRVEVASEYPLDTHCPYGGSMYRLANDHRLVTCGTEGTVIEVDEGGAPVWQLSLDCDGKPKFVYRATPVFDPEAW